MELTELDKDFVKAINLNDIDKICELYSRDLCLSFNIFKKENIHLFDKSAKYLRYFRGWYYFLNINDDNQAKNLMKLFRHYRSFRNIKILLFFYLIIFIKYIKKMKNIIKPYFIWKNKNMDIMKTLNILI